MVDLDGPPDRGERKSECAGEAPLLLEQMIVHVRDGLFVCDPTGKFRFVNRRGAALLGFASPEEVVGRLALDTLFQREEDRRRFERRLAAKGEVQELVVPFRPEAGVRRYLSINGSLVDDKSTADRWIVGSFRDLTHRVALQQTLEQYSNLLERQLQGGGRQLAQERERLERLLNGFPGGIVIVDAACRAQWMNSMAETWFGSVASQGDRPFCEQHLRVGGETCVHCPAGKALRTGVYFQEAVEFESPSDGRMNFRVQATGLRNDRGEVEQALLVFEDMSNTPCAGKGVPASQIEIARMELRARELEEANVRLVEHSEELERLIRERTADLRLERDVFRCIVSSLGQALLLTDRDGVIRQANREAELYFRAPAERIIGSPLRDYSMLEEPAEADELIRLYRDQGVSEVFTDDVEHFGRWYQTRFSRVADQAGQYIGILLSIQDIHDRKLMEQQMRISALELESANQELADTMGRIEEQAGRLNLAFEELKAKDQRITEQNEKLLKDLNSARRIQSSLLPRAVPEAPGVRLAFRYLPCEQVGGDFLDLVRLDERHVAVCLADVSGHGVAAAMLAVFAKQAIKGIETSSGVVRIVPPDEILRRLNDELIRAEFEDMPFLTIFYGILDTATLTLRFAAAAHPAPVVVDTRTGEVRTVEYPETSPLGWFADATYEVTEIALQPGERLFLHTDGVTEIFDPAGAMFQREDLLAHLSDTARLPIEEFTAGVVQMVARFTQKEVQDDDITLITLDCLPQPAVDDEDRPVPRTVPADGEAAGLQA